MAALSSAQMVSTGGGSSVLGIFVSVLLNLVPGMFVRKVRLFKAMCHFGRVAGPPQKHPQLLQCLTALSSSHDQA